MKKKSIWNEELKNNYSCLDENIKTDILIIGGGLTGVLTAFNLNDSTDKITLVERNTIGSGITSRTTGKITYLQELLVKINKNKRDNYLKSQLKGIKLIKDNIEKYNIDCDFLENSSYLYTKSNRNIGKLHDIENLLKENNIKYSNERLGFEELKSKYSIKVNDTYEWHPIKYLNKIAELCTNTDIYENTNIIKIEKEDKSFLVTTENNKKIRANTIVIATNYPYFLKPLLMPVKVHSEKSYLTASKSNKEYVNRFNLINIDKQVDSIRLYQDNLIYLTNSKITANKVNDEKCFDDLINNKLGLKNDYLWSNIDLITNDYLPLIGKVYDNFYISTGYNAWGMINSHIGSKMLSDMIMNKESEFLDYIELFNPRRNITLQKIGNSTLNIFDSVNGILKGIFYYDESIYYSKGEAIYVDSKGKHHIVKKKCPHMKCSLLFNNVEKTWDCPCHGSRFSIDGDVISGPTRYSIRVK